MSFGFREIREIKREEKGLSNRGFDPDKRIDEIVRQAQALADQAWDEMAEKAEKDFDPDKRIVVS